MGELVVSRGDTPEILEPAEAPLDGVAVFASLLVVADFLFAIGAAQYPPVIFPRGSGLVHRQMRDSFCPLRIVEPKQIRIPGLGLQPVDQALESKQG